MDVFDFKVRLLIQEVSLLDEIITTQRQSLHEEEVCSGLVYCPREFVLAFKQINYFNLFGYILRFFLICPTFILFVTRLLSSYLFICEIWT